MLENPFVLATFSVGAGLVVILITLLHQKRLDKADAGALFVALGAGFSIPKGLFLCSYFLYPDPPSVTTKLHGYEKEIFVAGGLVVFLAVASLWSLCEKARQAE